MVNVPLLLQLCLYMKIWHRYIHKKSLGCILVRVSLQDRLNMSKLPEYERSEPEHFGGVFQLYTAHVGASTAAFTAETGAKLKTKWVIIFFVHFISLVSTSVPVNRWFLMHFTVYFPKHNLNNEMNEITVLHQWHGCYALFLMGVVSYLQK